MALEQECTPAFAQGQFNIGLDCIAEGWLDTQWRHHQDNSGNNANPDNLVSGQKWPLNKSFETWPGTCGITRIKFSTTTLVYSKPSFNPQLTTKCSSSMQEEHNNCHKMLYIYSSPS